MSDENLGLTFNPESLAQAMMVQALSWLGNDKDISLEVAAHTGRAIAFYQKMGFVIDPHAGPQILPLKNGKSIPGYRMVRPAGTPVPIR